MSLLQSAKHFVSTRPRLRRLAKAVAGILRLLVVLPAAVRFLWLAIRGARPSIVGTPTSAPTIAMLVISEVHRDPRVEREARALAVGGFSVRVLYPVPAGQPEGTPPPDWGPGVAFRPLARGTGDFIFRFPYVLGSRLLAAALEERPFAFHAHDLSTCIVALTAARRTGARCVCDFHEWYSENASWDPFRERYLPHPWYMRWAYRRAEGRVMREATRVVTVCDSIAEALSRAHGGARKVEVVRNIAPPPPEDGKPGEDLRRMLGLGAERFLVLYQGGLGPSRYLEPIIRALAHVPQAVFVIRGPAMERFADHYRAVAREAKVESQLFCLGPVPSARVVAEARSADAGIWTLPDLCPNFRFALPNKIFEYLAAGLPVLAAGFPEAKRIVEGGGVGVCFNPDSPVSIGDAIRRLATDGDLRARCRAAIGPCLEAYDARREWGKLVDLYRSMQ